MATKTIYFIRHGQSEHNVFEEAHCKEPGYKDPNLFDAALSELGRLQVSKLIESVASFKNDVELVVVSPLSRAITTCLGAFNPEEVSNACDIGTPRGELQILFPHLDFSLVANEVWWYQDDEARKTVTAENYKQEWLRRRYEEPETDLLNRISEFRQWLKERPESVIVVVGHSNFFKFFLGMTEKLNNCEVYKHHL